MMYLVLQRARLAAIVLGTCASLGCSKLETDGNGLNGSAASDASGAAGASGSGASGSGVLAGGMSGAASTGGMVSVAGSSGGSAGMIGSGGNAGMIGSGGSAGMSSTGGSGGSGGSFASGGSGGSFASGGSGGSGSGGCGPNHHSCYVAASDSHECFHYQDVATCGDRCEPCPAPTQGGIATCSINGECGVLCDSGFLMCKTNIDCAPTRWDFEDETVQGFELETEVARAVTGAIASLPPPSSYEGSRALRIPFTSSGDNRAISVIMRFCNDGYVDLGYRTLSMAVRFEETSSNGMGTYQAMPTLGTMAGGGPAAQYYEPNTWYVLTHETESAGQDTWAVGFYAGITRDATGYVWIDDIKFE